MTTWFIVMLVVFGAFKIIVSSLPNTVIESIISKYETHPQLEEENATVTINGNNLEGEQNPKLFMILTKVYFRSLLRTTT